MDELVKYIENLSYSAWELRTLVARLPETQGTRLREGIVRLEAAIYFLERAADACLATQGPAIAAAGDEAPEPLRRGGGGGDRRTGGPVWRPTYFDRPVRCAPPANLR